MKKRNLLVMFILSIITLGIYHIYWVVSVQSGLNERANDGKNTSGLMVILLSIITCGIYFIFWRYRTAVRLRALTNRDNVILIMIFTFVVSFVGDLIIQSEINKIA